ncbi:MULTISPECIES: hypothetical protein [unclassified Mesorhizobium]|uniref:hypothetical protein n=1 Tax=unclassified Mesorhizobium TaxID=325217 RepID=UPI0012EBBDD8|nr:MULTISPECIES: hypothetical protein [unclassified Mesorhizobium]WJI75734.1 hypothetical protein NLY37_03135 [Mesorhizobium sp. C395A]
MSSYEKEYLKPSADPKWPVCPDQRQGRKISAVEGLKLSQRMGFILKESRERGLSGDERRALIKDQVTRKK